MSRIKDTILYVDDEVLNLQLFTEYFNDDFHIITCESPLECDQYLKSENIKVIISDQSMPEESGLDFIQRINVVYPDIIKILFTAYSDHELAIEAINRVGIYRYLLKPWNFNEMKNSIESAIREYDLKLENKRLLNELKTKNNELIDAFDKLKESEKMFYDIFSHSNDGIYLINFKKELLDANKAFYSILNISINQTPEATDELLKKYYPELIEKPFTLVFENNSSLIEIEINTEKEEKKYLEISSNPLTILGNKVIMTTLRDITDRRMFEKKILDAIIQTQEEIQGKYARELHDGLGPILSTLKMHIEWIADPNNTINKDKIISHSISAINDAIRNVREIANNLSPHILQRFGLVNAVLTYIERIKEASGIDFVVSSNIKEKIPENMEIILYRVVLECINNAMKHSKAKKVIIKFNKQKNNLYIGYSDNGVGFDIATMQSEGRGMGIFNIQNRIKNIGGEFRIISNPDIGTDIGIHIDVK